MKVVIDTNLLIDGVADDYNYGNRIIDAVLDGRIEAFANEATLRENRLLSRRKISDEIYLNKLQNFFDAVKKAPRVEERIRASEDRDDNKLLESAVAVSADYLISSDKHLLVLQEYEGVKIVTPSQFWSIFEEESGSSWDNWVKNFLNQA
ncbi:MAG TPA: putative toxin-antitoxin system toxin component, PIN family [Verrucomicrobiae bacterium]|nr:putative toxin-antitoxin system toxin component, PIN family [Verrucomicrobiae bacterium]